MKYNVDLRRSDGSTFTAYGIEIPQTGLLTIDELKKRYAAANMIVLAVNPVNGSSGATSQPTAGSQPLASTTMIGNLVPRLVIKVPDLSFKDGFRYDTGAMYAGCSRSNTDACIPIEFGRKPGDTGDAWEDVKYYCKIHNETPVMVTSPDEAWNIIEGKQALPSTGSAVAVGILTLLLALPKIFNLRG